MSADLRVSVRPSSPMAESSPPSRAAKTRRCGNAAAASAASPVAQKVLLLMIVLPAAQGFEACAAHLQRSSAAHARRTDGPAAGAAVAHYRADTEVLCHEPAPAPPGRPAAR